MLKVVVGECYVEAGSWSGGRVRSFWAEHELALSPVPSVVMLFAWMTLVRTNGYCSYKKFLNHIFEDA